MAEELAPDGSGEAPTQQASLTFFDYGCCVPSWQGLWMLIVVLLLMIAACGFCIGLNVCLSVYYTRRSAQREEQLEKKFREEEEMRQRTNHGIRRMEAHRKKKELKRRKKKMKKALKRASRTRSTTTSRPISPGRTTKDLTTGEVAVSMRCTPDSSKTAPRAEREKEPDTDPKVVAATVYHMSKYPCPPDCRKCYSNNSSFHSSAYETEGPSELVPPRDSPITDSAEYVSSDIPPSISPSPRITKQNRRGSLSEVSCDPDEATVMERGSGKRAPRIDRGDDIQTRTFTEEMSQEESRLFSSQRSPEFRSMRITEPMYTRDTPFWTNPQMRSAERHNQRPARPIIYDPPSTSTTAQTSTTRSSEPTRKSDGCQAAYVQGYAHRPMHHRPS